MQMYLLFLNNTYISMYSLSAPTRGATRFCQIINAPFQFQPALPRGERRWYRHQFRRSRIISTSAPTRGATPIHVTSADSGDNFNPRSHEGSDRIGWLLQSWQHIFQSALPRGERPTAAVPIDDGTKISIRAPTRGATCSCLCGEVVKIFQSALPRGERLPWHDGIRRRTEDFNPRSHEGSDQRHSVLYLMRLISIRAPTRGATSKNFRLFDHYTISIRAPTRGATLSALRGERKA